MENEPGLGEAGGASDFGLDAAYSVDGPDDNRALYKAWAATYDGFLEQNRYIYARQVAEFFNRRSSARDEPVLDVGCGTGVVGAALRHLGVPLIDGLDISLEMMAKARQRTGPDGSSVYRRLIEADLTGPLDLASDTYAGIVSAGTFTHGHVGPDGLAELVRIARPGSVCSIGINAAHFDAHGFRDHLDRYAAEGRVSGLEVTLRPMYEDADGSELDHMTQIAVFVVTDGTHDTDGPSQ
ncbi:MAG: class I SAM-dependent methyltransferase [Acidimicrobiaceae bacterium]|nr:class I SAM-dependent methyltransferase [Acidimicrobiaceae bacterium]